MKKRMLLVIAFMCIILLAGCGSSVKNESAIQTDLETYLQSDSSLVNEKIVEVKVEKRQTEKDAKLDKVWCTVTTEDEQYAYEKSVVLTYVLYDEGGWILEDVSFSDQSGWSVTPIAGINSEEISTALVGMNVTADNETWQITKDNIKTISIIEQETDLEAQKDSVTIDLVIDSLLEEASGQLIMQFAFDNKWVIDSVSGNEQFTAAVKPGMDLKITEDALLDVLSGQSFLYGVGDITQTITIAKTEVSNLTIESQNVSEKGTIQEYIGSCVLSKAHAEFVLDIDVQYSYSDNWDLRAISINGECTSVKIAGNWVGTMYKQVCELNITEVGENGTLSGTYTYYSGEGSYYVSGKIDLSTLAINLVAGDEIIVSQYGTSDIKAQLNIDDSTISGNARHSFVVAQ